MCDEGGNGEAADILDSEGRSDIHSNKRPMKAGKANN